MSRVEPLASARIDRIVVRPPNWLGDAVLALPAIAAIREHFASAHLTIAATPSVSAIFREGSDVAADAVIELPSATTAAVAMLAQERFGVGILLPNSWRSAWQFWRAGIGERWGYARSGRGVLLTRRAPRVRRAGVTHQLTYYTDLVRGLGITCDLTRAPRLEPSRASNDQAGALLEKLGVFSDAPLLGCAPGAAYGQAKQWPPARMAEAVAELVRQHAVRCVIVGAAHDRQAARAIESWLRTHAPDVVGRVTDLTGRTSLGVLVGVLRRTAVFVSNDSGAMHLAAALGRPVVAVFGPTDERATAPIGQHAVITESVFCRPCLLRDCPIDHRCMTRIPVARITRAVGAYLGAAAAAK